MDDQKSILKRYLQTGREALLWKLEGLSERDLRMPRTGTGTNLLGIVKHMINVELGYFGDTFGRAWPTAHERVSEADFEADPQADWYATAEESAEALIDLYRRVWSFADATIDELDLDAVGTVPWWPAERATTTLHHVLVHVLTDLSRHAGQADILREQIDASVGFMESNTNVPGQDWSAYVAKLADLADRF